MDVIKEFATWMKENSSLSDSSVYKYSRAVNTVSSDMLERGVISESLLEMPSLILDRAVSDILKDDAFVLKNTTGNNMYSNSLKQFRLFRAVEGVYDASPETVKSVIDNYETLTETERSALVKSRIGQGLFKKRLLHKYENKCVVTGIDEKKLLIASHVKPWAVCSNAERLSAENGLLLTPTFDKLFDRGLITFSESGRIYFSSQLSESVIDKLHISEGDSFDLKVSSELKQNLQYHQDVVFVTQKRGKAI
jgi:predicted restriction endonuclease